MDSHMESTETSMPKNRRGIYKYVHQNKQIFLSKKLMIFDSDHACHGIIGRAASFGHRQSRVHDSRDHRAGCMQRVVWPTGSLERVPSSVLGQQNPTEQPRSPALHT